MTDAEAIKRIIDTRADCAQWTLEDIEKELSNPYAVVLLDESKAAFISVRAVLENAEIENLGVLEASSKKGLASTLIEKLFINLKECGVKNITLEVREGNAAAVNFYKKHGFSVLGKREKFYQEEDALLMGKKL